MKSPASYFSFFFKVPALLQLVEQSTLAQCLLSQSQVQSHITECECKWLILAGDMLNELKNRGNRTPNEYK